MDSKNILGLLLMIFAGSIFSFAQPKNTASAVRKFPAPTAAKIAGCNEAYCVNVNKNLRICKTLTDNDQGIQQRFILQRAGKIIGQTETNGSSQSFAILQSDLDADGTTETIAVSHDTTSNGLGVRYYTINIWSDLAQKEYQAPLTFGVEEFGERGTFVQFPGSKEVLIFATNWLSSETLDNKPSTYLMGRWFRYQKGKLVPAEKPILVRRLLTSFQNERDKVFADPPNLFRWTSPYSWFTNGKGRELKTDPEISGKETILTTGTITGIKIEQMKDDPADADSEVSKVVTFQIKTVAGAMLTYVQGYEDDVKAKLPQANHFMRFGLQTQHILLPEAIQPNAIFADLIGTKVQIASYQTDPELTPIIVLWLAPAR